MGTAGQARHKAWLTCTSRLVRWKCCEASALDIAEASVVTLIGCQRLRQEHIPALPQSPGATDLR